MTRRERAIERDKARAIATRSTWSSFDADCAINAYEAELAADLESEEVVQRALDAARGLPGFHERGQRVGLDSMRAALRTVLEE